MLRNTSPTAPTVLAPQRLPNQAENAEVFFVEFPLFKQLSNDRPLLIPTTKFRNIARVFDHRVKEETGRQSKENRKEHIQNWVGGVGFLRIISKGHLVEIDGNVYSPGST